MKVSRGALWILWAGYMLVIVMADIPSCSISAWRPACGEWISCLPRMTQMTRNVHVVHSITKLLAQLSPYWACYQCLNSLMMWMVTFKNREHISWLSYGCVRLPLLVLSANTLASLLPWTQVTCTVWNVLHLPSHLRQSRDSSQKTDFWYYW